ncbi:hypothetical protein ACWE6T_004335, partial [Escherichia coli]
DAPTGTANEINLRAYQLVSKLDARRKQTSKISPYFVPYPATVGCINGLFVVTLHDFDLETRAETRELAISHASMLSHLLSESFSFALKTELQTLLKHTRS